MKRAILLFAAAAVVGLPLGQAAMAHDDDHGRHGRGPPERGEERRGPASDRGQGRGPPQRGYEGPRYEPRREERRDYERDRPQYEPRQYERRAPPGRAFRDEGERRGGRWDDPRYDDGPPPAARRGGYLPGGRGDVVEDYQRYRLRAPPRGYAWVRVAGGYALVSLSDGRVYDMVQ